MTLHSFLKLIWRKKQTFFSVFVIFFLIAGLITAVQPFRYGSNVKVLVVRLAGENVDPYVASRSNEQLSELLAKMIHSYTFFEKVLDSDFIVKSGYFSGDKKDQIKKWKRTVEVKTLADTGIINIDTYHIERNQTEQLAKAIVYTLQTNHQLYHGYGDSVQLREIDTPIVSKYPVKPDVLLTLTVVIALSILLFFLYIYAFPEEKYDIRFWPKSEKNNIPEDIGMVSIGQIIEDKAREFDQIQHDQNNSSDKEYGYQERGDMKNVLK
ncbi:hypothetical protein GF382_03780 [Candidatus Falkowbacteria bacterium]|nr:hypothetical protein [Candidatus Falkowbacteria bacterium]